MSFEHFYLYPSLLTFLSARSLLITSIHVFEILPGAKLPPTRNFWHLLGQELSLSFLKDISTSSLAIEQKTICEGELTEIEIYEVLAITDSNKSPCNDGLTKKLFYTFWNEVKDIYMDSLRESKGKKN